MYLHTLSHVHVNLTLMMITQSTDIVKIIIGNPISLLEMLSFGTCYYLV